VDLVHLGEPVGRLVVARRDATGPLVDRDRRTLEALARRIAVVTHSLALAGRLQSVHRDQVRGREEDRRRLRNDLHDGLGPTLSAAMLTLAAAQNHIGTDDDAVRRLVADARAQVGLAVGDVRRIVEGLRPPALDDLGLVGALRAWVARLPHEPCRVELDVPHELPPLPAAVEVAAYSIVLEAVTNALRHADATVCVVRLGRLDDAVEVVVEDDGCGPGGWAPGVGIASMRERVAELDGALRVGRGRAAGTTVRARLPLAAVAA
jgi:two-component system, NarL family, sensor kinase